MTGIRKILQTFSVFLFPFMCFSQVNTYVNSSFFTPSPTYLIELRITSDSVYRNTYSTNLDTLKDQKKYKLLKVKRLKEVLALIVSDFDHEYEVICVLLKPNERIKIAFTDVFGWQYYSFPSSRFLKKQFSNSNKLPFINTYSKKEVEEFANLKPLSYNDFQSIGSFLDSLIYIKSTFLSALDRNQTYQKATVYMFHDFVSSSLVKNNISPFYHFDFFQFINEAGAKNKALKEKAEIYYSIK